MRHFENGALSTRSESEAVLDDARNGDDLAIELLCFALEAGADSLSALDFLNNYSEVESENGCRQRPWQYDA